MDMIAYKDVVPGKILLLQDKNKKPSANTACY